MAPSDSTRLEKFEGSLTADAQVSQKSDGPAHAGPRESREVEALRPRSKSGPSAFISKHAADATAPKDGRAVRERDSIRAHVPTGPTPQPLITTVTCWLVWFGFETFLQLTRSNSVHGRISH